MLHHNVFIYNLTFFLNNTPRFVNYKYIFYAFLNLKNNMSVFPSFYRTHSCFTPTSPSEKERSKRLIRTAASPACFFSRRFDCSFMQAKRPLNHLSGLSEEILIQQIAMTHKFLLMRFPNFLGKKIDNT